MCVWRSEAYSSGKNCDCEVNVQGVKCKKAIKRVKDARCELKSVRLVKWMFSVRGGFGAQHSVGVVVFGSVRLCSASYLHVSWLARVVWLVGVRWVGIGASVRVKSGVCGCRL